MYVIALFDVRIDGNVAGYPAGGAMRLLSLALLIRKCNRVSRFPFFLMHFGFPFSVSLFPVSLLSGTFPMNLADE